MRFSHFRFGAPELGIDLGTANTLVVAAGTGVVFDQPSVCCFQGYDAVPRFIAAGSEAHKHVGKVSRPLKIVHPLRNGVLSDMSAARELLSFVHRTVAGGIRFRRIRAVIGVPADATQAEKHALSTAAMDGGFAEPQLLAEPLLAAIGLGLDVEEPRARMIVDCGAGTTEVAVIALGAICLSHSVRGGGEALDQSLADHLHSRHRFQIGAPSAEALKLKLSSALAAEDSFAEVEIRGLDAASGLPRMLCLPPAELLNVWNKHADQIVRAVKATLSETPPELSHDILEDGIILTGGAAMTALLSDRISVATGIGTEIADAPLRAVAKGLQRTLEAPRRQ
jgi:rod shape-determining protein MreB and related proteins